MDLLENIFEPYGQVPWDDLIDPSWTDLLSHVDEARLALDSGFVRPDEERLSRACLPGATESQLRYIALMLPRMNRNSFRRHCLRLLPLLTFPASGR